MDFALSEEQLQIREMVEGFAAERLAPNAGRWDREAHFPLDEMRELAGLGLAGVFVDPEYGGSGMGRLDGAIAGQTVTLLAESVVRADVTYETVTIQSGADIEGTYRHAAFGNG